MSQAELQSERHEPSVSEGATALTSTEQLVKAREARGLAPSDLAVRLGMVPRQVLAIERGDWTALPGRSFARSALRSYGRVLGVEVAALLPSIDQAFGETHEYVERPALDQPMPRRGVLGFSSSGSGTWLAWTLLIAVALVVLAFFYGGGASLLSPSETSQPVRPAATRASPAVPPSVSAPVSPGPGATAESPAVAPASSAVAAAPVPNPSQTSAASAPAPAPTSAPAPTPATGAAPSLATPSPSPAQPGAAALATPAEQRPRGAAEGSAAAVSSGRTALTLSFSEPAWIEVRDGSGRVVVTGTQPAGSSTVVDGPLPISAVIGNAGRVTVTWRGAPFDLTPHLRQGVARFNIE
jgi:cytoskeleton protein RodZ